MQAISNQLILFLFLGGFLVSIVVSLLILNKIIKDSQRWGTQRLIGLGFWAVALFLFLIGLITSGNFQIVWALIGASFFLSGTIFLTTKFD